MEDIYCVCGKGWYSLIDEAQQIIDAYNKEHQDENDPVEIIDVKEKWGTLRIELNYYIDNLYNKMQEIEEKSAYICEECGSTEHVTTKGLFGWVYTLCEKCRNKRIQEHEAFLNKCDDHKEEFLDYPYLGIGEKPSSKQGNLTEAELEGLIM